MNKPLCKNLQNIDINKTVYHVKFSVCMYYWSGDFWRSAGEKSHFEKTAFKDMYCNWNLQTQIDKVL